MKPLTTEDHDRWGALIALCLRAKPAAPLTIRRVAAKCRAVRGDRRRGATTPEGYRFPDSCFWRLLSDAEAYQGTATELYALTEFASACEAVLDALPPPVKPKPSKPGRWKRNGAFRPVRKPSRPQNARWMSRADLNN